MADNPTIYNGPLPTFITSADESPSGYIQRVKATYSANGVDTPVQADVDGYLVNLGANNDVSLNAGTNNIGDVDVLSLVPGVAATSLGKAAGGVAGATDTGVGVLFERRDTLVTLVPAVGQYTRGLVGQYGDLQVSLATTLNASQDSIALGASALNGCDTHNTIDLDETEEQVKATAGTVYGFYIVNRDTAPVYVKLYNATAANVTVGTNTPKMTMEIPFSASQHLGTTFAFPPGIKFDTAICIAATTGIADADTGAPGANDVTAIVFYK